VDEISTTWATTESVDECVDLLNQVFEQSRTKDQYLWKFYESPLNKTIIRLAYESETGELLAHYAVMPVEINHSGEYVKGGQSGDTAVAAKAAGRGLFKKCATETFDSMSADGYQLVYGFPNSESYPGFVRRLGWRRISRLTRYTLRLKAIGGLLPSMTSAILILKEAYEKTKKSSQNEPPHTYNANTHLSKEVEGLWNTVKDYEACSIVKNLAYLDWRYSRNRLENYLYYEMRIKGILEGIVIYRCNNRSATITEVMVARKNIRYSRRLIRRFALYALHRGMSEIVFEGLDDGFFDTGFQDFKKTSSNLIFCVKELNTGHSGAEIFAVQNWTVTGGDLDFM
jgi:hypothetical protein